MTISIPEFLGERGEGGWGWELIGTDLMDLPLISKDYLDNEACTKGYPLLSTDISVRL